MRWPPQRRRFLTPRPNISESSGTLIAALPLEHSFQSGLPITFPWRLGLPDFVTASVHWFSCESEETAWVLLPSVASNKRRREFIAGRLCAVDALRRSGCTNPGLLVPGKDRLPDWPRGWCGSISHTSDCAIAAVAPAKRYLALGVDIEKIFSADTARSVQSEILSPEEILLCGEMDDQLKTTLVFSAKESVYKALYSQVRRVLDFDAARLSEIGPDRMTFLLTEDWSRAWPRDSSIQAHYAIQDGYVCTAVCIPRGELSSLAESDAGSAQPCSRLEQERTI